MAHLPVPGSLLQSHYKRLLPPKLEPTKKTTALGLFWGEKPFQSDKNPTHFRIGFAFLRPWSLLSLCQCSAGDHLSSGRCDVGDQLTPP